MFAGVALGMAINLVFPSIPVPVAVAATMGGAMVATMKAPIFSAIFVTLLVERSSLADRRNRRDLRRDRDCEAVHGAAAA